MVMKWRNPPTYLDDSKQIRIKSTALEVFAARKCMMDRGRK